MKEFAELFLLFYFLKGEFRVMKINDDLRRKLSLIEGMIFELLVPDEVTTEIINGEEVTISFNVDDKNRIFF